MMRRLQPGTEVDGLLVGESLHEGGTGYIYRATPRSGPGPLRGVAR